MKNWMSGIRGAILIIVLWVIGWGLGFGGIMELIDPDGKVHDVWPTVLAVPGFIGAKDPATTWQERSVQEGGSKDPSVRVLQNGLENSSEAPQKIDELRALSPPRGTSFWASAGSGAARLADSTSVHIRCFIDSSASPVLTRLQDARSPGGSATPLPLTECTTSR